MPSGPYTSDTSKKNRDNGLYLLGVFYRDSELSKAPNYPITNFDNLRNFLDSRYPSFIEALGEQMKTIESPKLVSAMRALAKKSGTTYPNPGKFAEQISIYGVPTFGETTIKAVKESAEAVYDFSLGSIKVLMVTGVIAFGIAIYTRSGGKIKLPKLK